MLVLPTFSSHFGHFLVLGAAPDVGVPSSAEQLAQQPPNVFSAPKKLFTYQITPCGDRSEEECQNDAPAATAGAIAGR